MGKTGKAAKRKRLLAAPCDPVDLPPGLSPDDLATTTRVLRLLSQDLPAFTSPPLKSLRVALAPLFEHQLSRGAGASAAAATTQSPIARISAALRYGRWEEALSPLRDLVATSTVPKLGSVQRWVRDIDAWRETTPGPRWTALDAVVRACAAVGPGCARPALGGGGVITVRRTPVVTAEGEGDDDASPPTDEVDAAALRSRFTVVLHTPAAARVPPNRYPLTIYRGDVPLSPGRGGVTSRPVPALPGAVLLSHALSRSECGSIIAAADALGWVPDEILAVGGGYDNLDDTAIVEQVHAGSCVWLADDAFINTLLERMRPHLPSTLRGRPLVGINSRCRLYRYGEEARYRPHIDGAWPGSGFRDGAYVYNVTPGAYSCLTVVVYCNDGFDGGATTFYLPGETGVLLAHDVAPRAGAILVFPHGETPHPDASTAGGYLVHEGSEVTRGCKIIMRTDVLYATTVA